MHIFRNKMSAECFKAIGPTFRTIHKYSVDKIKHVNSFQSKMYTIPMVSLSTLPTIQPLMANMYSIKIHLLL